MINRNVRDVKSPNCLILQIYDQAVCGDRYIYIKKKKKKEKNYIWLETEILSTYINPRIKA